MMNVFDGITRFDGRIGLVKLRVKREGKHLLAYTTDYDGFECVKAYSFDDMDENYKMMEHEIEYTFTWVDREGNILTDDDEKDCIIENKKRFNISFQDIDGKISMHIYDSRHHKVYKHSLTGILTDENIMNKAQLEIQIIKEREAVDNILLNGFSID